MDKSTLSKRIGGAFFFLWCGASLLFLAFLVSSFVLGWPESPRVDTAEKRKLATRPPYRHLGAKEWGRATEVWFNDRFPFRPSVMPLYRHLNIAVLRSPVGYNVPGRGAWVFGRGREWPEVEDYMGIIRMTPEMVDDWRTLFEGRVAWAEAHGAHYFEVVTPMKIHVHPEKVLPLLAAHRRESYREDLRKALAGSPAASNVLFLIDALAAEVAAGREVYYEEDHHENAYGCYCVYREIANRLRALWFPDIGEFPFYETPPEDVAAGKTPGCWVNNERRLVVSNPDAHVAASAAFGIAATNDRFPQCPVFLEQKGSGRLAFVFHDSFLRYPLSTWYDRDEMAKFAIPLTGGFGEIAMYIFARYNTKRLDRIYRTATPDLILEQFSEGRLQYGPVGLDDTMRRAAAWGRAAPLATAEGAKIALPSETGEAPVGGKILALAVLENLRANGGGNVIAARLKDAAGKVVSTAELAAGLRRAVFFGDVPASGRYTVELDGGRAAATRIELRRPAE